MPMMSLAHWEATPVQLEGPFPVQSTPSHSHLHLVGFTLLPQHTATTNRGASPCLINTTCIMCSHRPDTPQQQCVNCCSIGPALMMFYNRTPNATPAHPPTHTHTCCLITWRPCYLLSYSNSIHSILRPRYWSTPYHT